MKTLTTIILLVSSYSIATQAELKSTDMSQKQVYENIGGAGGNTQSNPAQEAQLNQMLEELKKSKEMIQERNKVLNEMLDQNDY